MSKIRGITPLLLATAFGIGNGIWVFGPILKEQEDAKRDPTRKQLELNSQDEMKAVDTTKAEADGSTGNISRSTGVSSSWWPRMNILAEKSPGETPVSNVATSGDVQKKTQEGPK